MPIYIIEFWFSNRDDTCLLLLVYIRITLEIVMWLSPSPAFSLHSTCSFCPYLPEESYGKELLLLMEVYHNIQT